MQIESESIVFTICVIEILEIVYSPFKEDRHIVVTTCFLSTHWLFFLFVFLPSSHMGPDSVFLLISAFLLEPIGLCPLLLLSLISIVSSALLSLLLSLPLLILCPTMLLVTIRHIWMSYPDI